MHHRIIPRKGQEEQVNGQLPPSIARGLPTPAPHTSRLGMRGDKPVLRASTPERQNSGPESDWVQPRRGAGRLLPWELAKGVLGYKMEGPMPVAAGGTEKEPHTKFLMPPCALEFPGHLLACS